MNQAITTIIVAVIGGLCGSGATGLIQFLIERNDKKKSNKDEKLDAICEAVCGLDHDRLYFLCSKYIEQGHISQAEYDNLKKYLYEPYKKLGGNGTGERLMQEINKLPFKE